MVATRYTAIDGLCHSLAPLLQRHTDAKPVVLMLCGVAGSGKSTLAKAIAQMMPSFERISIDGIIASRHGIYGVNYEPSKYATYQEEADNEFLMLTKELLTAERDVILDRSFYAKEDRDAFKSIIGQCGGRCVLVYFAVPQEVLWERIQARRSAGINADSALEISREMFDMFFDAFEVPSGEGEVVVSCE